MKLKILLLIQLFYWINYGSFSNHAVYIAVIEINHIQNDESAEVLLKVFTNDLEVAIRNDSRLILNLESDINILKHSLPIEKYFKEKLVITINQNVQMLSFKSNEIIGDSVWLTFDLTCPKKWTDAKIQADILMELFPTQSNIVGVKNGDDKQFLKLTIDQKNGVLRF